MGKFVVRIGGECYEIALLRDGDHSRNIRTCVDRRHSRRRLVYVSETSSVEVVLLRRASSDLFHGTFILHYTGIRPLLVSSLTPTDRATLPHAQSTISRCTQ